MYTSKCYEPKTSDFWGKNDIKEKPFSSKVNDLNYEFKEEYTTLDISIKKIINGKNVKTLEYKNELVLVHLTIDHVEKTLLSNILSNNEKSFDCKTKVLFDGELIKDVKMTIGEMLIQSKTFQKYERKLIILVSFDSNTLELVDKKLLPKIHSEFQTTPPKALLYRKNLDSLLSVSNFSIWNKCGKIEFLIPVNLTKITIDKNNLQINNQNIQISDSLIDNLLSKSKK